MLLERLGPDHCSTASGVHHSTARRVHDVHLTRFALGARCRRAGGLRGQAAHALDSHQVLEGLRLPRGEDLVDLVPRVLARLGHHSHADLLVARYEVRARGSCLAKPAILREVAHAFAEVASHTARELLQ
eukprot:2985338-Lingulodinium_polyedra.AAC.1